MSEQLRAFAKLVDLFVSIVNNILSNAPVVCLVLICAFALVTVMYTVFYFLKGRN